MASHRTATAVVTTALSLGALITASCSDTSTDAASDATIVVQPSSDDSSAGVRLVTPEEGAAIKADAPADLVVLDVRTPEEFAEGHLDGAIMVDFYAADFTDQLADLDPDVPYLLYCRSGSRSGQAAALMEELGFVDVANVDGGILAWSDAGLDVVDQ